MTIVGGRVAPADVTVGRDLGPAGRWIRVVSGVLLVSYGLAGLLSGPTASTIAQTVAVVAVVTAYYVALHRLLGERLFARSNPWFGTTILLGSLGVFMAPFMPEPVQRGAVLYAGATLVLTAIIRYGGCEVVALPTLLFRRRYVLYCPFNAVDAPERSLHHLRMDTVARLAAVGTAVVGVYFLLVAEILAGFGLADPVASWWALLLLAPAGLLAYRAWQAARQGEAAGLGEVRVLGLGAVVLVALAVYFAAQIRQDVAWAAVMLGGLLFATGKAAAAVLRRRRVATASVQDEIT